MNTMTLQSRTDDPVFVNLLSDAGFKAVYADPANKPLLIYSEFFKLLYLKVVNI